MTWSLTLTRTFPAIMAYFTCPETTSPTSRRAEFRKLLITLFDSTVDPYSPREILEMMKTKNIRWLILKKTSQGTHDPTPDRDETLALLHQDYVLVQSLTNYEILQRR